jgi:phage terminase large subunit-like protein
METHLYVEDPRDPNTGQLLPPGPIQLAEHQKRILREALAIEPDTGLFRYSTVVFSTVKKSGKTRLAAGVAAWFAATRGPYQEIYCMANDGKQSKDRILSAVKKVVTLNPMLSSGPHRWKVTQTQVVLPNQAFIEAIPCDPKGSAGSNPSLTVWSEMWGYSRAQHKERLWTEMTIPPTRWGRAIRWVESYAGFSDDPGVLWDLYVTGTQEGHRHPDFPDLPVYVNEQANMFCYWDEGDAARRMPWQQGPAGDAYYIAQSMLMLPSEFDRVHRNKWATSIEKAIHIENWDACRESLPPLDNRQPCVISCDASVSGDCSAMVLMSWHPTRTPKSVGASNVLDKLSIPVAIRGVRIWEPPKGGTIDLDETIGKTMREWWEKYNVIEVCYDQYQLHDMMTRARRGGIRVYSFGQTVERYLADKSFKEMVLRRMVAHDGHSGLRTHVDNAAAKIIGEKYRFVKPEVAANTTTSRYKRPIDALVAASMGAFRCRHLILEQ